MHPPNARWEDKKCRKLFFPHIEEIVPDDTDLVMFDGASNVQLAGMVIEAKHPRVTTIHGIEHVSSFFGDFADVPLVKTVNHFCKVLDGTFSSSAHHAPHVIFMKQSQSAMVEGRFA